MAARRLLACLMAPVLIVASVRASDSWPQFRGPTGDGHGDASNLPETWSESRHVMWKTPIHGRGWSSPVVRDDRVWMTTATADGRALYVVCVRLADGKTVLDRKLFDVDHPQDIHATNSHASPTPVIESGHIYVHFGAYGTACLSTEDGRTLWQRRDFPCNHWRGAGSSPILFEDLLIVHFDGYDYQYVVALDKATGQTRWKNDRAIDYQTDNGDFKKAFCTPTVITVDGQPQLISPAAKATIAYRPRTGEELWRVRYANHSATARPLYGLGLVLINTGFSKARLLAVRPGGRGDVTDTHIAWTAAQGIGSKPSHLLIDGLLYVIHDRGTASCLDARTGELVWKDRVGGNYSASPVFADGKIYCCNESGTTTVLRPGRTYVEIAKNELEDGCMASPAIVDNSLLLRTTTHLYRIAR